MKVLNELLQTLNGERGHAYAYGGSSILVIILVVLLLLILL